MPTGWTGRDGSNALRWLFYGVREGERKREINKTMR